ncbi:thioredoxin-related transmembrane protein 4 isoform X1 [Varanus komodoensis]|uniref:Thioredoxin related transmembrane protein 4 n=1 Tax=Varanus komodoensis TaxID=61221 RepID=A0A8D2KZT8_VARKO|nr:thioredoxin-related transmembrane protein 4 isoform X1 [Varanus komodoensis]
MAAALLQSGADAKPPGWESKRRNRVTAPLLMLWGAAAAAAWASLAAASAPPEPEAAESRVWELSGTNWSLLLQGQWMVEFYAPWCPACQQMESVWEAFARNSEDLELNVGKVDVTEEPGVSGRFFVTTLPTIYHAKDGVFRRYRGSRTLEDLQGYILEKKWEAVEPVAGWKSPSSIVMHGMAGLFHFSGWIRQIHDYLTGALGLPIWGSYAVFVLATILIGLILGLILVLLTDCIYPPKSNEEASASSDDKTEEEEILEHAVVEPTAEKGLSNGEDEKEGKDEEDGKDESQDNSSNDSAVEGSEPEDDLACQESDKVEKSSLRQRKNQVEAYGL